jgi:hypothetical protein
MASRVTQEVVEAVTQADPSARVTQEVVEAVTQANPNARLSALYVEAVCSVDTIYEGEGDIVATASLSASARIVAGHEWQAIGLLIEGVRNPADSTDQNPVLFVQGDLSGGLDIVGAPLAGATVLPWIPLKKDAVGGFGWVADPRKPVGPGAPATVRINDNRDQLGPIFAEDLGVAPPTLWEIRESRLTRTQTAIRVYGPTAPTVGSIVWLNEEAVYLSSVTTATDNFTHDLVVVRARCGSRARAHRLRPKSFPAGEDGKHTRLYLRSRPDFDRERWQATLYLFDVQGNTAVAIRKMKRGYVLSRPRPTGTGYVVTLEDFTKNLHAHRFGGRADVPITHAVQALTVQKSATPSRPGGRGSGLGHVPPAVLEHLLELAGPQAGGAANPPGYSAGLIDVYLTRAEAEFILDEVLQVGDASEIDETIFDDLVDRMTPGLEGTIPISYDLVVEAGGWAGIYKILELELKEAGYQAARAGATQTGLTTFVKIRAQLLEHWEGSISDQPIQVHPDTGIPTHRLSGLNAGWSSVDGDLIRPGEEGPKISLWFSGELTPFEALCYMTLSDLGDGGNHATFDAVACGFGADVPALWLDIGAAGGDPATLDPGTSSLLELAVLKPKRYRYRWPSSGDWSRLGRWLENEALLSITMWSDDPLTGACGLRACDRTVPVTPPESLVAVKGQKGILNPGTRLGKVQALRIEVGFQGKDLAYQDFRLFRLKEADTAEELEESNILAIRIWDRGALFAPSAQNAGPIPRVVNYYLRQLRLAPSVYKIPASILRGANRVGGFYKLTDTTLQNANGRGFVELVVLVVGVDTEWTGGAEYLLLLPYALPLFAQTTGKIAPSLRIFAVDELAGAPAGYTDFDLWVTSIGDPGFNVATAYNNFFSSLASSIEPQGGRVRIVSTEAHNPFAGNERRGWLEASARVLAANYDGAHSRLKVRIADEWKRGGDVDLKDDLLVPDRSFVLLGDFRPAAVNVEGVDLVPSTYQRASSPSVVLAAAAYAPPAPTAPYDRYYYLFA